MAKIPSVRAAGGVLWRELRGEFQLALVHRPRYDDWSFPKGKAKPGEQLLLTALREVHEETGHTAQVGPALADYSYPVTVSGRSARKTVRYWAMRAVAGEFVASEEVDQMRWAAPAAAAELLTSPVDRRLLRTVHRGALTATSLLIVGSGSTAGSQSRAERTLDARGRRQADELVPLLHGIGVRRLLSAPSPRCAATLRPYAEQTDLVVRAEPDLSVDSLDLTTPIAADRLLELAGDGHSTAACVDHADVGPLVVAVRGSCGSAAPVEVPLGPAGWCLLQLRGRRLVSIDRETSR